MKARARTQPPAFIVNRQARSLAPPQTDRQTSATAWFWSPNLNSHLLFHGVFGAAHAELVQFNKPVDDLSKPVDRFYHSKV